MRYLLQSCTVYTGHAVLPSHSVLIQDHQIEAVLPDHAAPVDVSVVSGRGFCLCPGLLDLQVYGADEALFSVEPTVAVLRKLHAAFLRQGTTGFLTTMPTNSWQLTRAALEAGRRFRQEQPDFLGIHLEGPFLNPEKKGAHQAEFILPPTVERVDELLELGQGVLRMVTMAPEVTTPAVLARLRAAGVVVSAGHSNATYAEAAAGFAHGFTAVTHLFNAMSALQGRAPGLVGATYDDAQAQASIIADGIHCDLAAVRISKKMLGERLFLITDAVTSSRQGAYRFRRHHNQYVDENGTLAGSALTLLEAVRNCTEGAGIELAESLRMATLYPARVLGLDHRLGRVAPGYQADLCLFDEQWRVRGTVQGGRLTWHEPTAGGVSFEA
ncbi:N-acetylglucosamine-6-phosphate deacetylase [Hymenobacter weizhouensis]|uniref:N-acetylglucosamine-6-phosphate deacetylase n=1 Tax=Hymenobacter sp. YIM 151500-1 TaxID=2987689 RepID=UPI00222807FE|nr:N-acetylglucosamine-6-phosphate deacetylase [Hymenobacter sp. YIM 151500-1]UYZ61474.1 N-acetylglucosamine-6-phosphate deacetylase [Hymenobacter sp. YIM 151500-1]